MINRIFIVFVLLFSLFLNASTIKEDILKLQSAPKQDRFKIMNMIKLKLSKMNSLQRSQSIQKLFQAIKHNRKDININNRQKHKIDEEHQNIKMDKNKEFQNHFMKKGDKHFPKDHKKSASLGHRRGHR